MLSRHVYLSKFSCVYNKEFQYSVKWVCWVSKTEAYYDNHNENIQKQENGGLNAKIVYLLYSNYIPLQSIMKLDRLDS